jgi:hypothetical protein
VVFGEANIFANGSFGDFDVNASGRITFNGYVKGPGVQLLSDEGVWIETPAGLILLAREGNPAPGAGPSAVFGSGAGLHSFGDAYNPPVDMNDNGSVVFGAGLRGAGFDFGESVWVYRGGQLELVVKAFGGGFNSDPAPGFPGATFSSVYSARISGLDQVAMVAFAGNVQGIWWERNGSLELLARAGGLVPGIPGAAFNGVSLRLDEFTDSGTLYYTGAFSGSGINSTNDTALFAAFPDGTTRIVMRKGQRVRAGPGDVRVVSQYGLGTSSDDGEKTLKLVFTDGSTGLFTVRWQAQ